MSGIDAEDGGFEGFFRRLLPDAIGVAKRIVSSQTEAEDVAAEAFARALEHPAFSNVQRLVVGAELIGDPIDGEAPAATDPPPLRATLEPSTD